MNAISCSWHKLSISYATQMLIIMHLILSLYSCITLLLQMNDFEIQSIVAFHQQIPITCTLGMVLQINASNYQSRLYQQNVTSA